MHDLLVVLVTHNSADDLRACADSVRAHAVGCDAELIAVDSGSSDESVEVAGSLGIHTIAMPNVGYGAGNNEAWRSGPPARYMLLLNPDARVVGGSLGAVVRYADGKPRLGVLAPQLVDKRGEPIPSTGRFESAWRRLGDQCTGKTIARRQSSVVDVREFGWATGCALFVRTECFGSVGGFDERFFLYAEERDLQRATSAASWGHETHPQLIVQHDPFERVPDKKLFAQQFRADLHYARKWEGRGGVFATRCALALELLRRLIATRRDEWTPAYLVALRVLLTERAPKDPGSARALQIARTL